jgi:hypothetical protein
MGRDWKNGSNVSFYPQPSNRIGDKGTEILKLPIPVKEITNGGDNNALGS